MEEREIKFRLPFFDRDGKFVYFSYWGAIDTMNNAVKDHSTFVSPSSNNTYSKGWHQQFTGLKDKNGKEIYEGDVLAVFDINGGNDYDEENDSYYEERPKRLVKWNQNGGFTLEWDYGDFDITLLGWAIEHHELQIEIIGNIYESPELLNFKN